MQFTNGPAGWEAFKEWFEKSPEAVITFEPTGSYSRGFERKILAAGITLSRVNPLHALRFAEATGKLAKTDRVDARMLAEMVVAVEGRIVESTDLTIEKLKEHILLRRSLERDIRAAKNRVLEMTIPKLIALCKQQLALLEHQLKTVNKEIAGPIRANAELKTRRDLLVSMPGISNVAAALILTDLPELGRVSGTAGAALAGVAPINRVSGFWKGHAFIRGGRREIRRTMFMPALVAIKYDLTMKTKYDELRGRGKLGNVALVSVMREMFVMANAFCETGGFGMPPSQRVVKSAQDRLRAASSLIAAITGRLFSPNADFRAIDDCIHLLRPSTLRIRQPQQLQLAPAT